MSGIYVANIVPAAKKVAAGGVAKRRRIRGRQMRRRSGKHGD